MHSYVLKEIEIENGILSSEMLISFRNEMSLDEIIILDMSMNKAKIVIKGKLKSDGTATILTSKNESPNSY